MTNYRKSNPTVRRYVVSAERVEIRRKKNIKVTTYLWRSAEVDDIEVATHWGSPRKAYDAMKVYADRLAERSPEDRKAVFLDVVDRLAEKKKAA